MKNDLLVIGVASPYVHDVVESAHRMGLRYLCVDNLAMSDLDFPDHVKISELEDRDIPFVVGLSSPTARHSAYSSLFQGGFRLPTTLIDPTAILASSVVIGVGTYVNVAVVVASNTRIECGANINRSASIGHDNLIGHFASIGPGVVTAGSVVIGPRTLVGVGAVVKPEITIGRDCTIGAGAVVVRDVPDGATAVGNPARIITTVDPEGGIECPFC